MLGNFSLNPAYRQTDRQTLGQIWLHYLLVVIISEIAANLSVILLDILHDIRRWHDATMSSQQLLLRCTPSGAHCVCDSVAFSRWSTNTARVVRNDCSGSSRSAPNAVSENLTPMKSDKPRWLTNYISFPRWIDKTNAKEKLRKAKVKTLYYRGQGPDSDVARGTRGSCPPGLDSDKNLLLDLTVEFH